MIFKIIPNITYSSENWMIYLYGRSAGGSTIVPFWTLHPFENMACIFPKELKYRKAHFVVSMILALAKHQNLSVLSRNQDAILILRHSDWIILSQKSYLWMWLRLMSPSKPFCIQLFYDVGHINAPRHQ